MTNDSANQPRQKDLFDKLSVIARILATIAVPLVVAIVGNQVRIAIVERETRAGLVELSINILTSPLREAEDEEIVREWARDVLNEYSEVPLPEAITSIQVYRMLDQTIDLRVLTEILLAADSKNEYIAILRQVSTTHVWQDFCDDAPLSEEGPEFLNLYAARAESAGYTELAVMAKHLVQVLSSDASRAAKYVAGLRIEPALDTISGTASPED